MRLGFLPATIAVIVAFGVASEIHAGQYRSAAAKAEFKRESPCPANGHRRGPCPGYQIDHVIPLKCRGADHRSNMQWLTVEQHKEKTRREAGWCRKN